MNAHGFKCDEPLSNVAFTFNVRRYNDESLWTDTTQAARLSDATSTILRGRLPHFTRPHLLPAAARRPREVRSLQPQPLTGTHRRRALRDTAPRPLTPARLSRPAKLAPSFP